jgi:hypothetical protein
MLKRLKQVFESLAYAGLRPSGGKPLTAAQPKKLGWFGQRFEKFLASGGQSDPLYLSNRTFMQKAGIWFVLGVPSLILLGGLGLVLFGFFNAEAPLTTPPAGISNAELSRRMLPNLDKNLHVDSQHDVDVQDVHVVHNGSVQLAGVALNKTNHIIHKAGIVFELTDQFGSRQGAVTKELLDLAARSSRPFQFTIEQQTASFALVREVHVE